MSQKAAGENNLALISQNGIKLFNKSACTTHIGEVFVAKQMPLCFTGLGKDKKYVRKSEIIEYEQSQQNHKEDEIYLLSFPD